MSWDGAVAANPLKAIGLGDCPINHNVANRPIDVSSDNVRPAIPFRYQQITIALLVELGNQFPYPVFSPFAGIAKIALPQPPPEN